MKIVQDNIVIRSANTGDAQILTDWWNDGAVMAHAGFPNGLGQTLEETLKQVNQNKRRLSQRCMIEVGGVRVGEMSFGIGENLAEIGIKICDTSYQNKGYGSVLIKMLIDFLFSDERINSAVEIEKILLDTNLDNKRAQHVYEKIGFKKVATNRDVWQDQLGNWQSSVDYVMTLEDYQKLSKCETKGFFDKS